MARFVSSDSRFCSGTVIGKNPVVIWIATVYVEDVLKGRSEMCFPVALLCLPDAWTLLLAS